MNNLELLRLEAVVLFGESRLITETEAIDLLSFEIPSINKTLEKIIQPNNINQIIQCFTNFTKTQMKRENFKEVKHCFDLADKMLKSVNIKVKNAIEVGFYFQFSCFLVR